MMKLYRPLCSDVTLRLAVDISPTYDDDEEEGSDIDDNANNGEHAYVCCVNDEKSCTGNNKKSMNKPLMVEGEDVTQTSRTTNSRYNHTRNHSHNCSWYSRQNTPDKTAKDIYNHEHVLGGTEDFQKIPLDSEFKRCVEEEGNDFKDMVNYKSLHRHDSWEDHINFSDVDKERLPYHNERSNVDTSHFIVSAQSTLGWNQNVNCTATETLPVKYPNEATSDSPPKSPRQERYGRKSCVPMSYADQVNGACQSGKEIYGSSHSNSHIHPYETTGRESPNSLSDDIDDDVDVDSQGASQILLGSFYGEIDVNEVAENSSQLFGDNLQNEMTKSLAEEIHDVLVGDTTKYDSESEVTDPQDAQLPFSYPFTLKHVGHLFDKSRHHFSSTGTKQRSLSTSLKASSPQMDSLECSNYVAKSWQCTNISAGQEQNTDEEEPRPKRCSVSTMTAVSSLELEVTHRGLHRFIPRHKDEMNIGIGDPIHVIKECDDLWCEGINLRTGERGIFPAMYANDLNFLEESDDDEEYWKFSMKFLGSVEVTSHKGDDTLVRAINKVAQSHKGNINTASLSTLEINQYGIRMIDKSKEGHEKDAFSHFFALKNISFCGTHPKNNRYFAFITKHPREYRFACHVFHGDRPTHRARDAVGEAFKRFYQEYMAFTHPTEDIYME